VRVPAKLAIGAATVAPLGAIFALAGYIVYRLISHELATTGTLTDPITALMSGALSSTDLVVLGAVVLGIALFELTVAVGFIIHAAREPRLGTGARIAWIFSFVLLAYFSLPLYWLLYILRDGSPRVAIATDGSWAWTSPLAPR
jgi:hypothetical protein